MYTCTSVWKHVTTCFAYLFVHCPDVMVFNRENNETLWVFTQQWFKLRIELHRWHIFDGRKAIVFGLVNIWFEHFGWWCTIYGRCSRRFARALFQWKENINKLNQIVLVCSNQQICFFFECFLFVSKIPTENENKGLCCSTNWGYDRSILCSYSKFSLLIQQINKISLV